MLTVDSLPPPTGCIIHVPEVNWKAHTSKIHTCCKIYMIIYFYSIFFCLICFSIHPFLYCLFSIGSWGSLSQSQVTLGERQGIPWTGRQSVIDLTHGETLPLTLTFTPMGNSEWPINLICMILVCGRKPVYPQRTQTSTRRIMQTPLLLWGDSANYFTTVPFFHRKVKLSC